MRYARIENGRVSRLLGRDPGVGAVLPVESNMPDHDPRLETVTENPPEDWTVEADRVVRTYTRTPRDLEADRKAKLDKLPELSRRAEQGGFEVDLGAGPVRIGSDEKSQIKIVSARVYAEDNPSADLDWHFSRGKWGKVNAKVAKDVAGALGAHIQAVYSHAKAVEGQIRAATTLQELWAINEAQNWPGLSDETPDTSDL